MSKQAYKRLRRKLQLEVNRDPLPVYAWPGGYPIIYYVRDCAVLCPDCVNGEIDLIDVAERDRDRQWEVVGMGTYDEGPPIPCDNCGKEIESSYGDPDEDETETETAADVDLRPNALLDSVILANDGETK